jgi:integrase
MPGAEARGSIYQLKGGAVGIRYRDATGQLRRKSPFPNRTAARTWFREQVAPELRGEAPAPSELCLSELVELYLQRHAAGVRPRTIETLRERLVHAERAFGDIRLRDLQHMSGDIASWQARLPERSRYGVVQALRQCLSAAVRWGLMQSNPATAAGRNRQPSPRTIRTYTRTELQAIGAEMSPMYATLPMFAAATGLRPEELFALERRDIDRRARVLTVRQTLSGGELVELGKTDGSRRQVPLSQRALDALDGVPPRLDSPLIFPAPKGGPVNIGNWRRRQWTPAIEAAGIARPARPYDTRATFISDALSSGRARVHRREDRRDIGPHDRALLRAPARRRHGRYRRAPGRPGCRSGVGRVCRMSATRANARRRHPTFSQRTWDGSDGTRTRDLRRDRPAL